MKFYPKIPAVLNSEHSNELLQFRSVIRLYFLASYNFFGRGPKRGAVTRNTQAQWTCEIEYEKTHTPCPLASLHPNGPCRFCIDKDDGQRILYGRRAFKRSDLICRWKHVHQL